MERPIALGAAPKGSVRELLGLAWPLVLSNSVWMVQVVVDRVLLSRDSLASLGAGFSATVLFWTLLILFQSTANYATTFVAQYTGAGQPRRVGAVVWQAIHFSLVAGIAFQALQPLAGVFAALGGHEAHLQQREVVYFRCLCLSALPTLLTAAVSSFFAGRGDSRTVLVINVAGLGVNALAAYALIFGHGGCPALGIAGAGWATVLGTSTSALLALPLMLRRRYRASHATASAWRFDRALFLRLMRFGVPNGLFAALDGVAFTLVMQLIGRLGQVDLAVTSIALTLNLIVFCPTLGIGQAVEVLVGQRLGEDEPDLAARTTRLGLRLALVITAAGALAYLLLPDTLAGLFHGGGDAALWEPVRLRVPVLLRFVALYALFDTANVVLSFALRGAGDTRFVTCAALALSWPIMVVPAWLVLSWPALLPAWAAYSRDTALYWVWGFASLYLILLALTFWLRFRQGKWRSMRVIEAR